MMEHSAVGQRQHAVNIERNALVQRSKQKFEKFKEQSFALVAFAFSVFENFIFSDFVFLLSDSVKAAPLRPGRGSAQPTQKSLCSHPKSSRVMLSQPCA
jgi:hypothetical protein